MSNYKYLLSGILIVTLTLNTGYGLIDRFFQPLHLDTLLLFCNGLLLLSAAVSFFFSLRAGVEIATAFTTHKNTDKPRAVSYSDQILIDNFPNILCIKDKDGHWLNSNDNYLHSFNLQNVDYAGKSDLELAQLPNSNLSALHASAIQDKLAWKHGVPTKETRLITYTKLPPESFEITRIPVYDAAKNPFRLILTGRFLEQNIKEQSEFELMSAIFHGCHLSLLLLNNAFVATKINSAFTLLSGYVRKDVVDKPITFVSPEEKDELSQALVRAFTRSPQGLHTQEIKFLRKNGSRFAAKIEIQRINSPGDNAAYLAIVYDITQQKLIEKRLTQVAHYDDLTSLGNRAMFLDRLIEFLSASKRHNLHAVVFFIDLDRFKAVNDSLGHDAGDELLKETAARLLSIMRKEDVVARLSGDEFALLLLNEKSHEQAIYSSSMIAEKVISLLSEVFFINRREVFIGASIGISIFPEDGDSAEVLLKHADIAMYEAKNQGRNNYQFYKKAYTDASKDRMSMEINLRKAIENNELQLFFQPQYHAQEKNLWGAEVLIRWFRRQHHGVRKMIPPAYFIPIAEDTGLIIEIGKWILEQSCLQIKQWLEQGYPLKQLSVNISARQFADINFLQIVEDALLKAQLAPHHLELEITESMLVGDTKRIELQLNHLKKMGIKIALDDFGTGYSSLSYLKNFPIDILKIDQSFVRDMTTDSKDARIAYAIIDMGHSLGQKIVAEGVETEAQLRSLSQRGCDIIQGYFFSPPVSAPQMTSILQGERAKQ